MGQVVRIESAKDDSSLRWKITSGKRRPRRKSFLTVSSAPWRRASSPHCLLHGFVRLTREFHLPPPHPPPTHLPSLGLSHWLSVFLTVSVCLSFPVSPSVSLALSGD